jgi:hypothetical protein
MPDSQAPLPEGVHADARAPNGEGLYGLSTNATTDDSNQLYERVRGSALNIFRRRTSSSYRVRL